MAPTDVQHSGRQRNPRGQGERLREDIIEAACELLEDPAAPPLSLRGVARAVGVAATSVYLHFDDVDELLGAVAERHLSELSQITAQASDQLADPCERVQARALAYCEYGLAHPGRYQVMFSSLLPLARGQDGVRDQIPVGPAFGQLAEAAAECLDLPHGDDQAVLTATLIWQQLHGTVSLRISRTQFHWPPLAEEVPDAVGRLLAGTRAAADREEPAGKRKNARKRKPGAQR
jgi:AcrR family transcriptional regulator